MLFFQGLLDLFMISFCLSAFLLDKSGGQENSASSMFNNELDSSNNQMYWKGEELKNGQMSLKMGPNQLKLQLFPSHVTDRLRVYTFSDGKATEVTEEVKDLRKCVYQDRKSRAVVSHCEGAAQLEGIKLEDNNFVHFRSSKHKENEYEGPADVKKFHKSSDLFCHTHGRYKNREKRNTCGVGPKYRLPLAREARIEVFVLLEYRVYQALGSNVTRATEYAQVLMNAVDLVFAPLHSPRVKIVFKKLMMITSSNDNAFFNKHIVSSNNSEFVSTNLLDEFGTWLNSQGITDYDHAHIITGTDITGDRDVSESGVAGVAFGNGVCMKRNSDNENFAVGLSEDLGQSYSGVSTVAHEIMHNIGVPSHDSEQGSEQVQNDGLQPDGVGCPGSGMLMAAVGLGIGDSVEISNCSLRQMHFWLSTTDASCVFEDTDSSNEAVDSRLPGTVNDLNAQCRSHGHTSSCDRTMFNIDSDSLCYNLPCMQAGECAGSGETTLDGTPCDTGKACYGGSCLSQAPISTATWTDWSDFSTCVDNVQFRYRTCKSSSCGSGQSIEYKCDCLTNCPCPVENVTTAAVTTTPTPPASTPPSSAAANTAAPTTAPTPPAPTPPNTAAPTNSAATPGAPAPNPSPSSSTQTKATTTTEASSSSSLPTWAIGTIAGIGGAIVLAALIGVAIHFARKGNAPPPRHRHKARDRNDRYRQKQAARSRSSQSSRNAYRRDYRVRGGLPSRPRRN